MSFKAAFIFIAPEVDCTKHHSVIQTPVVELITVGVKNYDEAEKIVAGLLDQGITAFELCGGFGAEGVARVAKIVKGKAAVGVVRFDVHPGLQNQSGDALFG